MEILSGVQGVGGVTHRFAETPVAFPMEIWHSPVGSPNVRGGAQFHEDQEGRATGDAGPDGAENP